MVHHSRKLLGGIKAEHTMLSGIAIPFLGMYPTNKCTCVHKETWSRIFKAALFIVVSN